MKQIGTAPGGAMGPDQALHFSHEEEQPAPSLRDLLEILRRRKAIALQTLTVILALGAVLSLMTKPIYRSSARLLVEGRRSLLALQNNNSSLGNLLIPSAGHEAETQVEILRSSGLTDRVYKEAGLGRGVVVLDVRRVSTTDVIELSATSNSPEAATRFAQVLPQVYLRDIREQRLRAVSTALEFAEKRLVEERTKLAQTEEQLEKFKQRAGLVDPTAQREADLTASAEAGLSRSRAQASVSSLRAQLDALEATRNALPGAIESGTTTTNPALGLLQERLGDLRLERNRLRFQYKDSDDEIRKVDLQIAALQSRIARTPGTISTRTRTANPAIPEQDAKIADARASLSAAQADLRAQSARARALSGNLGRYNSIERQQAQLAREIATATSASTGLTENVEDLSLRKKALEAADDPIATIEAAAPAVKIAPSLSRNMIMALALGLLLACGAAMLQESLDDHIRDEDEVRRLLGVPVLGHFPMLPANKSSLLAFARAARVKAAQLPATNGASLSASNGSASVTATGMALGGEGSGFLGALENSPGFEAALASAPSHLYSRNLLEKFRVLRSNVQFTLVDRPHSTILVTSSVPQEGKSYTATNLAVAMALDGRRVILVDADLHRPRAHEIFGVPVQPGLTNVLVGQAQLEGCLRDTGVHNLRLLTAGVLPPNPVELLNSPTMEGVMAALSEMADVIIFDSPPLLATADAQVLASKVDGVLYVMQMGRVPRSSIQRSFELLGQARANVIGIVLNKIDEKTARNTYGSYGSYSYYADDHNETRPAAGTQASGAEREAAGREA